MGFGCPNNPWPPTMSHHQVPPARTSGATAAAAPSRWRTHPGSPSGTTATPSTWRSPWGRRMQCGGARKVWRGCGRGWEEDGRGYDPLLPLDTTEYLQMEPLSLLPRSSPGQTSCLLSAALCWVPHVSHVRGHQRFLSFVFCIAAAPELHPQLWAHPDPSFFCSWWHSVVHPG